MNPRIRPDHRIPILALATCLLATVALPAGASTPEDHRSAVRDHVRAIEESFRLDLDALVAAFEDRRLSDGYLGRVPSPERREVLDRIRRAAADAGGIGVDVRDGRVFVRLEGEAVHVVEFAVEDEAPWRIDDLAIRQEEREASGLVLTRDDLAATFERLEREGFSGVVHARLDGEVVLDRAFGAANAELGIPVRKDTVFGTGSRPIDYTRAAVYLLEQEGKIDQDATLDRYFDDVPADKRAITVRHLMEGRSGLPDFFDTPDDWDPDLAWVDRETAVRRLMARDLLFPPGSARRHSHGAFGLLAALVEKVSGMPYAAFLRERFFEPAGMTRTGSYGETLGLGLDSFAVGGGPSRVGLPNIPPNWGPTSWLVMGSGGMVSTVPDLRRFYDLVRSTRVLAEPYARRFRQGFVSQDGSDRGFELFHVHVPPGNEIYLLVNMSGRDERLQALIRALGRLAGAGD